MNDAVSMPPAGRDEHLRFVSQLISATRDRTGAVVNGDPQSIREVTDIWMFCRDISTAKARANPNWKLVATQAPA